MATEQTISTWIRRHHGICERCHALVTEKNQSLYWTTDGWLCKLCEWRRARQHGDSGGEIE